MNNNTGIQYVPSPCDTSTCPLHSSIQCRGPCPAYNQWLDTTEAAADGSDQRVSRPPVQRAVCGGSSERAAVVRYLKYVATNLRASAQSLAYTKDPESVAAFRVEARGIEVLATEIERGAHLRVLEAER